MECIATKWNSDGAIGRLWSDFLPRVDEIKHTGKTMTMYGICEHEDYDNIEVYDEEFKDPSFHRFRLLIPVQESNSITKLASEVAN